MIRYTITIQKDTWLDALEIINVVRYDLLQNEYISIREEDATSTHISLKDSYAISIKVQEDA